MEPSTNRGPRLLVYVPGFDYPGGGTRDYRPSRNVVRYHTVCPYDGELSDVDARKDNYILANPAPRPNSDRPDIGKQLLFIGNFGRRVAVRRIVDENIRREHDIIFDVDF